MITVCKNDALVSSQAQPKDRSRYISDKDHKNCPICISGFWDSFAPSTCSTVTCGLKIHCHIFFFFFTSCCVSGVIVTIINSMYKGLGKNQRMNLQIAFKILIVFKMFKQGAHGESLENLKVPRNTH